MARQQMLGGIDMRRRTFDALMVFAGLALTAILVVAGGLLAWGHSFVNSEDLEVPYKRREACAAEEAAARPPAGLRGLVDLRVRRRLAGRVRPDAVLRLRAGAGWPRLVALQPGRPLLQQHPLVERRAVYGLHGDPPRSEEHTSELQ